VQLEVIAAIVLKCVVLEGLIAMTLKKSGVTSRSSLAITRSDINGTNTLYSLICAFGLYFALRFSPLILFVSALNFSIGGVKSTTAGSVNVAGAKAILCCFSSFKLLISSRLGSLFPGFDDFCSIVRLVGINDTRMVPAQPYTVSDGTSFSLAHRK
jgi:hypothetical protein